MVFFTVYNFRDCIRINYKSWKHLVAMCILLHDWTLLSPSYFIIACNYRLAKKL